MTLTKNQNKQKEKNAYKKRHPRILGVEAKLETMMTFEERTAPLGKQSRSRRRYKVQGLGPVFFPLACARVCYSGNQLKRTDVQVLENVRGWDLNSGIVSTVLCEYCKQLTSSESCFPHGLSSPISSGP